MPVMDADGALIGIVEPQDRMRAELPDRRFRMRALARRDHVPADPGESVDPAHRHTMLKNTENEASEPGRAGLWAARSTG